MPSRNPNPQTGILTKPPERALVVSYDLTAADPAAAHATVERLRGLLEREERGDLDDTNPGSPKDQPSAETGELGFADGYQDWSLTITTGFAKTAFDKLGVAAEEQPQDLVVIPWALLGDTPSIAANGELVVQICSGSAYVNEHVVRRIEEELGTELTLVWVIQGDQRHQSKKDEKPNRGQARALNGFLDGTSNLDPRRNEEDKKLVLVDPGAVGDYPPTQPDIPAGQPNPYGGGPAVPGFPPDLREPPKTEPAWTKGGSYMTVRASELKIGDWDKRNLGDQEHDIGRFKVSGQALDNADDPSVPPAEPDFAADPGGGVTPLNAHIRKANPRGPGDEKRRIFRRGYPLVIADVTGMKRGLLFVCFGRTLTTQFEFITRAWTTNENFPQPGAGHDRLRDFEGQVLCGGYFFVPPLKNAKQPWSWILPDVGGEQTAAPETPAAA